MIRFGKAIKLIAVNLLVLAGLILLLEGAAGFILLGRRMRSIEAETANQQQQSLTLAERHHTEYDRDLGWINLPNVDLPDMYGPGKYLRTNAQRFRNNEDIAPDVPEGKVRILCGGDSFTLGYGVDNDHTWCAQLQAKDPRFQVVNMGQGGYGIDQAFLWYKRDGVKIRHNLTILAFITWDFDRMETDTISGYGKPILEVKDGTLVTNNVPVPRKATYASWVSRYGPAFMDLQLVRFFGERAQRRKDLGDAALAPQARARLETTRDLIFKIFADLDGAAKAQDSIMVLVYLPTEGDYKVHRTDAWREVIRTEAQKKGWLYVDFFDEFRRMPPEDVPALFIPQGALNYRRAAGHYSETGNAYMASILYRKLMALTPVANLVNRATPPTAK